jgi:acid phosphatase type 7
LLRRYKIALVLFGVVFAGAGGFSVWQPWNQSAVLVGAGDIARCPKGADEQTAALLATIPGTVFTTGDNAYEEGSAAQLRDCYGRGWGKYKDRTRPAPGNHDYLTLDGAPYYSYFGKAAGPSGQGYYSYDLANWHIVVLNSSIPASSGSEQAKWLEQDLTAHQTTCTLAYWHYPLFSSGAHGNNEKMRPMWEILYRNGADLIINGHDHNYERFAPQTPDGRADWTSGIRQFVVGTGGTGLREFKVVQPNSLVRNSVTHGVLKLTLRASDYSWEFVPIAGQSFRDIGNAKCVASR